MKPQKEIKHCKERLDYYYEKLLSYDPEEREDYHSIEYIEEKISEWKKNLLIAEEKEFFGKMDEIFHIG